MSQKKLLGTNRQQNTFNLKRLIKERKRKAQVLKTNLQGLAHKKQSYVDVLKTIYGILEGEKQKSLHWNKRLLDCKECVVKKRGPTKDVIDIIKELDEKADKLARIANVVLNQISKEENTVQKDIDELSRVKESVSEFVNDTLHEVNTVTAEARATRYEETGSSGFLLGEKAVTSKKRKLNYGRPENAPKTLITTMFRLYRHDKNTDINGLFKKKKNK